MMSKAEKTKSQCLIQYQRGQAMVETIVILVVVAGLWVGISWIGKIQDLALNNINISSYAAFATSFNQGHETITENSQTLLNKQAYQWRNYDGSLVLKDSYGGIEIDWLRSNPSPDNIQIGMGNLHAKRLREQWLSADIGILNVHSSLSPIRTNNQANQNHTNNSNSNSDDYNQPPLEEYSATDVKHQPEYKSMLELEFFVQNFPKITRHTSIATGAAYSSSNQDTVNHIQKSEYGWSGAIDNSYKLGKKIDDVASSVDGAWSRTRPNFDWLHPWENLVPNHIKK